MKITSLTGLFKAQVRGRRATDGIQNGFSDAHAETYGRHDPDAEAVDPSIGGEGWLTVVEVKKAYRKRQVVKGVSLAVGRGESVGPVGANGAGKTTVF